jgi:hypothetical protein
VSQQLDVLMDDLATARDTEAAARMDVRDRKADEDAATLKRHRAESRLMTCIEQSRKARCAVTDYIEWQTHPALEEADDVMRLRMIEDKRLND